MKQAVFTALLLALTALSGCLSGDEPDEGAPSAAEYTELQEDFDNLQANHTALEFQLETLTSAYNALEGDREALEDSYKVLEALNAALAANHSALEISLAGLESRYDTLEANYSALAASFEALETEYLALLENHTLLQAAYQQLLEDQLVCGPGTRAAAGECVSTNLKQVYMPFESGTTWELGQSAHGYVSHHEVNLYAFDIPCPENTTIVASQAGVVIEVREDSSEGCGDESCANQSNYVIIDHGDNTFAWYLHLVLNGSLVEVGDEIHRGQTIGLSGDTGWSTEPHLHFMVTNLYGQSIPLYLSELADVSEGVPFAGARVTSANVETDNENPPATSTCPADVFLHMGVRLASELPCSVAELDRDYDLQGWTYAPAKRILLAQYDSDDEIWRYQCYLTDGDGRFDLTLRWDSAEYSEASWMMVASADDACYAYQSWDASIGVWLV